MTSLAIYLPALVCIALMGGFLPLIRELSAKKLALLLSFSGGVLLGAVFFHMIPETGEVLKESLGLPIIVGFLLIFILERFVFVHACKEEGCDFHQVGLPAFLGISFHSLLDGIALGAGSEFHLLELISGPVHITAEEKDFDLDTGSVGCLDLDIGVVDVHSQGASRCDAELFAKNAFARRPTALRKGWNRNRGTGRRCYQNRSPYRHISSPEGIRLET